jgi:hypothetical protein
VLTARPHRTLDEAPARCEPAQRHAAAIQPSTAARTCIGSVKALTGSLTADTRPPLVHRVAPGSSGGAPARHQARRAAPRRDPAPERRSAPVGRASDWHHRREAPRAPSLPSANARLWPASGWLLGVDRTARTASTAGLLANAATVTGRNGFPGGPDGDAVARVTGPMTGRFAQVTGRPTPVQRLESAVLPAASSRGRCPIRTHVRRPTRPPLLYFPAVLPVRFVRIRLLTCGAKRARTADLLHAIWRQHVHPRPSVQVTVLPRPLESARVRVSCCTSVLYRSHPRRTASPGPR